MKYFLFLLFPLGALAAGRGTGNYMAADKVEVWLEASGAHAFDTPLFADTGLFPSMGPMQIPPNALQATVSKYKPRLRTAKIRHLLELPPDASKHIQSTQIERWLAEMGVFIGMTRAEIERYRQNPKGIEFHTLRRFRGIEKSAAASSFFNRNRLFTTLQLYKATTGVDLEKFYASLKAANNPTINSSVFGRMIELTQTLRYEIDELYQTLSPHQLLADVASAPLVKLLKSEGVLELADLPKKSEKRLLHLDGMTLSLAGELGEIIRRFGIELKPNCEDMWPEAN